MEEQQQRVALVLCKLAELVKKDKGLAKDLSTPLNSFLDDLQMMDFFGTEGENDPRGDFRSRDWDINFVQGIDSL